MRVAAPSAVGRAGRSSSQDLYADAVRVLGAGHPVARTQHAIAIATRQAACTSVLIAAAPCAGVFSRSLAAATCAAATLVTAIIWGAAAGLGVRRRTHVHDLIVRGGAPAAEVVEHEVARVLDPAHRAEVASRLGRALYEAEHWDEYLPASRPPEGVRHLRPSASVIHEITSALHGEAVSPRGVILLVRFLQGGYGADVYQSGGPDAVRRELGRIRFELGAGAGRAAPLQAPHRP